MLIQKNKRVVAEDELNQGAVEVPAEATDLLFEAEDVAQLLAEATGEDVSVEVDDDAVEFTVGDQVLTAEAEGDEEVVESSTRVVKSRKSARRVTASSQRTRKTAASRVRKAAPVVRRK